MDKDKVPYALEVSRNLWVSYNFEERRTGFVNICDTDM
jgi:hypothetical protein